MSARQQRCSSKPMTLRARVNTMRSYRIEEARVNKLCALAAALLVAQAGNGFAQEQQSFKSIMGKGYEIKSVTFARGEATENREIFLVTLQKDKSVAVCYFAAANWINLSPATLEDSKRCDVR
jgi:hypothetical protein